MRRLIVLSRGDNHFSAVLPSESLRQLVIRRMQQKDNRFDYVNTWHDVNGFGLQISAGLQGPPRPPRREYRPQLYKNPGYDLVNL